MARRDANPREAAETLAVQALSFLGSDPERLGRFLSLSGIGPESLRESARQPSFLAAVLDHLATDEALLVAFATQAGVKPTTVDHARRILGHGNWERDVP